MVWIASSSLIPITSSATPNAVADGSNCISELETLGDGIAVEVTPASGFCELHPVKSRAEVKATTRVVFILPLCPDLGPLILR